MKWFKLIIKALIWTWQCLDTVTFWWNRYKANMVYQLWLKAISNKLLLSWDRNPIQTTIRQIYKLFSFYSCLKRCLDRKRKLTCFRRSLCSSLKRHGRQLLKELLFMLRECSWRHTITQYTIIKQEQIKYRGQHPRSAWDLDRNFTANHTNKKVHQISNVKMTKSAFSKYQTSFAEKAPSTNLPCISWTTLCPKTSAPTARNSWSNSS